MCNKPLKEKYDRYTLGIVIDSHKELIKILNKSGDKCPPCGTSEVTKYSEDF